MTTERAIVKANSLRPNTFSDEQKSDWLMVLEGQVAEMMQKPLPTKDYPDVLKNTLLMPYPYDNIYPLYLAAIIDFYNQELTLYQNDSVVFEEAKRDAFAWYRRNNMPSSEGNWKSM